MSSDPIILIPILEGSGVAAILLYGAYWAFEIRRAPRVGYYRRQAFWAGIMCLYLTFSSSYLYFIPTIPNNLIGNLTIDGYYAILPVIVFGWADSSVRVSRRSDPLLRDTLRWSRLRIVVWLLAISSVVAVFLILTASAFVSVSTSPFITNLVTFPQIVANLSVVLAAIPALLLSARRSGDAAFRRSLKWFGLFGVAYLLLFAWYIVSLFVVGFSNYPNGGIVIPLVTVGYIITGTEAYCLYRSAKSLAPLNRISLE